MVLWFYLIRVCTVEREVIWVESAFHSLRFVGSWPILQGEKKESFKDEGVREKNRGRWSWGG